MRTRSLMLFSLLVAAALAACGSSAAPTGPATGSAPDGWLTYTDTTDGFLFAYPPEGQITTGPGGSARIDLPVSPHTTLVEKFLEVNAAVDAYPCPSPTFTVRSEGDQLTVGELTFLEQTVGGVATGNIYEGTAYSAQHGAACASLTFMLHSTDPGSYVNPPAVFDRAAETAVFTTILSTFRWTSP